MLRWLNIIVEEMVEERGNVEMVECFSGGDGKYGDVL